VAVNLDTEPLVQDRPRIHKPDSPVPNSRCVLDTERVSSARVMRCSNRSPVAGAGSRPSRPAPRTPTADPSSNSSQMRGRCCGAMAIGPGAMSTMTSSFRFRIVGPSRSFSRVWLLTPASPTRLTRSCARLRMLSVTGDGWACGRSQARSAMTQAAVGMLDPTAKLAATERIDNAAEPKEEGQSPR